MSATYSHNRAAFREEVLKADFMLEDLVVRALNAQAEAERISPIRTGQFASSWVVETTKSGGAHGDRAMATLRNDDPHAADIEFGHDTPADSRGGSTHVDGGHVLGRATAAMGD